MDKKKVFANQLKDAKKKLGLNHNQFAELIGHSRDTMLKWWAEVYYPDDEKREKILAILKDALSKKQ